MPEKDSSASFPRSQWLICRTSRRQCSPRRIEFVWAASRANPQPQRLPRRSGAAGRERDAAVRGQRVARNRREPLEAEAEGRGGGDRNVGEQPAPARALAVQSMRALADSAEIEPLQFN